jgi:putative SOS response-associated peptidase YedK
MPVVLAPENWQRWMNPASQVEDIGELLRPWRGELLTKEVTTKINKVTFQGPDCHEPDCPPQTELPLNSD